ncbi:hypothetical protein BpHYR1_006317 [Brachionus plicatilis]|uniref:Uncharacterized protein n=1 Tax=Brachionus plicatilis TaxID=10195 RepID=A0A3M7PNV2_BRAPC|nr:hypothetical protein BpHYR1_006317 [Brachionus plicatilis]
MLYKINSKLCWIEKPIFTISFSFSVSKILLRKSQSLTLTWPHPTWLTSLSIVIPILLSLRNKLLETNNESLFSTTFKKYLHYYTDSYLNKQKKEYINIAKAHIRKLVEYFPLELKNKLNVNELWVYLTNILSKLFNMLAKLFSIPIFHPSKLYFSTHLLLKNIPIF